MIETQPTKWKDYPDQVSFAIPVSEVSMPRDIESQLPAKTKFIEHTVYLGRQNHDAKMGVRRNFWEQRIPANNPSALNGSLEDYNEILDELGVPLPPQEESLVKVSTLYMPSMRRLSVIHRPLDTADNQIRVSSVVAEDSSGVADQAEQLASVDAYVDALESSGFPPHSFDHLRPNTQFMQRSDDTLSQLSNLPVFKQLSNVVGKMVGSFSEAALRGGKVGNLREIVRTERHIPKA